MRTVPERPIAVKLLSIVGGFLAGPLAAFGLSPILSPDSAFVAAVAPFSFALVLFFGILLWAGLGVLAVLVRGLVRMARGQVPVGQRVSSHQRLVPPGYIAFVVLGGLVGAALGVCGALLSSGSLVVALGGWVGLGLAYGTLLWAAAHNGYLPFPEEE